MSWIIPLVMLTGMEIILGIDNIIFLSILVGDLPKSQQRVARIIGLSLALGARMGLLLGIRYVMGLDRPLFHLSSLGFLPEAWLHTHAINAVTARDLVLLGGGLFLIAKSVLEIHEKMAALEDPKDEAVEKARKPARSLPFAIAQIIVLDLVFSLDSIISAIGMVKVVWIMVVAMTIAVVLMGLFSSKVSSFIEGHPTFKMLALSFLVLIGIVLIAEGVGTHISRGYVYVAMAFALGVEVLNMRTRKNRAKRAARTRKVGRVAELAQPGGSHSVV